MTAEEFTKEVDAFLYRLSWKPMYYDFEILTVLAPFLQQRADRLIDVIPLLDWILEDELPQEKNEKEVAKIDKAMKAEVVPQILDGVIERFEDCTWDVETLSNVVREVGDMLGAKSQVPVRIAVTGRRTGLPLFEPMVYLSRERVLKRLRKARAALD